MLSYAAAHHKTIMAVDIASYNDPKRTTAHRLVVHDGFWTLMRTAFAEAGIPWDTLFVENTGDGAMIQLPSEVPKADLVAQLPDRMLAELRRYNAVHAEEANVRLRVALHAGEVYQGSHGTVGPATSFAFRLLEAPTAKEALKESGAALALIVSDTFYQDAVRADPAAGAGSYHRIPVSVKETSTVAWLRLMGVSEVRRVAAPEPAPDELRGDQFQAMLAYFAHLQLLAPSAEREQAVQELADLVIQHDGRTVATVEVEAARSRLVAFHNQLEATTLGTPEARELRRQTTPGQVAMAVSRSEQHLAPSPVAHRQARKEFAEALRRLREQTGLSIRALEARSGVPKSTIADCLDGRHMPTHDALAGLLLALNITDRDEIQTWQQRRDALAARFERQPRIPRR
ncbi:helix-turn-helix domain-containing protein [Amycolatopsis sp. NPDC003861]